MAAPYQRDQRLVGVLLQYRGGDACGQRRLRPVADAVYHRHQHGFGARRDDMQVARFRRPAERLCADAPHDRQWRRY
jgi:hypothetical protein